MKRFLTFILIFSLLITTLAIPSFASSFDPENLSYFNLLDFGASSTGSNFIVVPGNTVTFSYNTPSVTTLTYVDMVVTTLSAGLTSVYAGRPGYAIDSDAKKQLNVVALNDRCYRIYGSIFATDYTSIEFNFFTDSSSRSYITVQSLLAYDSRYDSYNENGTLVIGDINTGQNYIYNQGSYGDVVTHRIGAMTNGTTDQGNTRLYLYCDDWRKYDRLEFCGTISSSDINSIITIAPDGSSLPYTVSYLGDPVSDSDGSAYATRNYVLSLDLTGIDRTVSDYPYFCIEISFPWNQGAFITLDYVHGFVKISDFDTSYYYSRKILDKIELFRTNFFTVMSSLQSNLSTWMTDLGTYLGDLLITLNNNMNAGITNLAQKLNTIISDMGSGFTNVISKLTDIITGSSSQNDNASDFNDSIGDQSNELDNLTTDLNSVTRPPLSDVNLSTSGMVDQSVVVLSTNGIGSILSNQIILRVLIMSLTFALAGFILFGKR